MYSFFMLFTSFFTDFIYFISGYTTNGLSGVSVGVGKSSLDPHSHLRQPGKIIYLFKVIIIIIFILLSHISLINKHKLRNNLI